MRARLQIDLAAFVFFVPANVCVKSAILLLYIRVFGSLKYVRRVSWFMVAFTAAFHLASLVVIIFACSPRSKLLNPLIPGKCINKHHLSTPSAGLNIFTDVVAFVLPIKAVLDLNASRHQKIQVLALFATGLLYVSRSPSPRTRHMPRSSVSARELFKQD